MKLLIVTQKVDQNDPILGFFCRWITEFAKNAKDAAGQKQKITVITLSKGTYDFPDNVKIVSLGKENGGSRLRLIARFFTALWRERNEYDTVFVHMNPEYIVLAGLIWRILRKKIFLWYVHRSVTWRLRIAHFFAHGIFSSTPESFRIQSNKVSFVGHAIPLDIFARPVDVPLRNVRGDYGVANPLRIVSVGRITPIKRHEILIDAVAMLRDRGSALKVVVSIVGSPVYPKDHAYFAMLKQKVAEQKLEKEITFIPAVPPHQIASWYWNNDLLVNLCPTGGLDKVVLEAMAAGTPVLVTNKAFNGLLGTYAATALVDAEGVKGVTEMVARRVEGIYKGQIATNSMGAYMQRQVEHLGLSTTISRICVEMYHK